MKHTIKNLINSPYDVITVDGPQRIPARGELTAEFTPQSLVSMKQMGYFQISEAGPAESKFAEAKAEETRFPDDEPKPVKRGPGRPKKAD